MSKNNEITEFMKMLEKMQARIDKSEKRTKLMASTLQAFFKDTLNKDGNKPWNEEILKTRSEMMRKETKITRRESKNA